MRQSLPTIPNHLPLRHRPPFRSLLQRHERTRTLPPPPMRHCHHRRLRHSRMRVQHALHLHAAYILPSRDYHILRSILYLQIPYPFMIPLPLSTISPIVFPSRGTLSIVSRFFTSTSDICGSRGFREAVRVGHVEAEGFDLVEEGGRGRRSSGEDVDGGGEFGGAAAVVGGFEEDVENDGGAAHVGDAVEVDVVVDLSGGGVAEADVGSATGGDAPGEGPAVAVEHGEGPEVDRGGGHFPGEDEAEGAEVGAAVAVEDAFGGGGGAGGVVEGDWGPLVLGLEWEEVGVPVEDEVVVVEIVETNAGGGGDVVDDDDKRKGGVGIGVVVIGRRRHENTKSFTCLGDVFIINEEDFGFGVFKDGGDVVRVKARVYGVEYSSSHGDCEMHLVQCWDVGSQNRYLLNHSQIN
ncbi:Uncharacterized protein G2W53_030260 [Senna tora]|uniref:Uncharacterized protein n=1 Tax=Senna tora TaxID=362788 RepID=A0A834WEF7_9FABA|nr:Uncharacterized protein G2W53_030260 [Senna tora]